MSRVRLVHWKPEEAAPRVAALRAAGHEVLFGGEYKDWKDIPCDVFVIDLSRLPSQGREVAIALRCRKATRAIPLVFVDGAPEKTEPIRAQLPDATYATWPGIAAALKNLRPLSAPVVPAQMMDRYAGRSTAQKLGLKQHSTLSVIDPPRGYARILGQLPEGTAIEEDSHSAAVTLCFVRTPERLPAILQLGRLLSAKTKFWIAWPKGKASPVGERHIRDSAIALGLVDYKVCCVDPTWSALLFR